MSNEKNPDKDLDSKKFYCHADVTARIEKCRYLEGYPSTSKTILELVLIGLSVKEAERASRKEQDVIKQDEFA